MMFMNFLSFPGGVHLTSLPPQVFGMVEENTAQGNVLVNRHVRAGQAIHIPQGIQHFSHNPTCRGDSWPTSPPPTQVRPTDVWS